MEHLKLYKLKRSINKKFPKTVVWTDKDIRKERKNKLNKIFNLD